MFIKSIPVGCPVWFHAHYVIVVLSVYCYVYKSLLKICFPQKSLNKWTRIWLGLGWFMDIGHLWKSSDPQELVLYGFSPKMKGPPPKNTDVLEKLYLDNILFKKMSTEVVIQFPEIQCYSRHMSINNINVNTPLTLVMGLRTTFSVTKWLFWQIGHFI